MYDDDDGASQISVLNMNSVIEWNNTQHRMGHIVYEKRSVEPHHLRIHPFQEPIKIYLQN